MEVTKGDYLKASVKADSLSKVYGLGEVSVKALTNLSIDVAKAEFLAIMGQSGSGKSTLLHLLGGLDNPSSGTVEIDGSNISNLSDKKLTLFRRLKIGFIFQSFNILPILTVEENIALPLIIASVAKSKYKDKLEEVLSQVGLSKRRNHFADEISGGEAQRVAIARALITEPQVILADEPTGNLDSKTGTQILELLKQLSDKYKQTIIMVTHDPKAATYADRLIILKDGRKADELVLDMKDKLVAVVAKLEKL
ncbi:MAG: ABC transporter ATP-binding protein [Actinobacteria bacterium]|nr:MAG: ABC transporter ATP-binding protein [Actinomycetota bacterium]